MVNLYEQPLTTISTGGEFARLTDELTYEHLGEFITQWTISEETTDVVELLHEWLDSWTDEIGVVDHVPLENAVHTWHKACSFLTIQMLMNSDRAVVFVVIPMLWSEK